MFNREHNFANAAQPKVVEPGFRRNETFAQYMDNTVHWTDEVKAKLQDELHFGPHIAACPTAVLPGAENEIIEQKPVDPKHPPAPELAKYPNVPQYKPVEECATLLPLM